MYVESFHNRVKTFYLKRRVNRRVDDLLNLLLKIEKDDFWRHHLDVKYKRQGRISHIETNRHIRGMQISDKDVEEISDFKWKVKSQDPNDKADLVHEVNFVRPDCFDDSCHKHCLNLSCIGLCGHMYHCTCLDYKNLCKHIHKIHSYRVHRLKAPRIRSPKIEDSYYADQSDEEPLTLYHTKHVEKDIGKISQTKLKRTSSALESISHHIKNEKVLEYALNHICNILEEVNSYCQAIASMDDTSHTQGQFLNAHEYAPNSKLKCQPRPNIPKFVRTSIKRKKRPDIVLGTPFQVVKVMKDVIMRKENSRVQ